MLKVTCTYNGEKDKEIPASCYDVEYIYPKDKNGNLVQGEYTAKITINSTGAAKYPSNTSATYKYVVNVPE